MKLKVLILLLFSTLLFAQSKLDKTVNRNTAQTVQFTVSGNYSSDDIYLTAKRTINDTTRIIDHECDSIAYNSSGNTSTLFFDLLPSETQNINYDVLIYDVKTENSSSDRSLLVYGNLKINRTARVDSDNEPSAATSILVLNPSELTDSTFIFVDNDSIKDKSISQTKDLLAGEAAESWTAEQQRLARKGDIGLRAIDYGIVGDGTDQTDKIIDLIASIPENGANIIFDQNQEITINGTSSINISNKKNIVIQGLNAKGSSNATFLISGGSENIIFRDCIFTDLGQVILLFTCSNILIDHCKFVNTRYGIIQQNGYVSDNVKVINCIADSVVNDFIELNCETSAPSKNWTIANNHFLGSSAYPSEVTESRFVGATEVSNIVIVGNIVENVSGDAGVHLENPKGNVIVSDNIFRDCRGEGYVYILDNAKDAIISNNFFESTESDNLTPFIYYYAAAGTSEKLTINANIFKGHSLLSDLIRIDGGLANPKIISNNQFIGFNILFDNKVIYNVLFTNNYVSGVAGLVFKTSATGKIDDWTISGNKFYTTGNAIDINENTNGNASPTKININGNTFNDNVVIKNAKDLLFYGNIIGTGKTVTFGYTEWHSERMYAFGNLVQGVGISTTDNKTLGHLELSGSLVWDVSSLADGEGVTSSGITITGARFGDYVLLSPPYNLQGITCNAYVESNDSIKIRLQNETGGTIDLASGTWKVRVIKQ